MVAQYRISPSHSRFTVQAFVTGMLSFLGHSPTFAVRDYEGAVRLDGEQAGLDLVAWAETLELLDQVRPADRQEIEGRMKRDVLETAAFPAVRFHSAELAVEPTPDGPFHARILGPLELHGVTGRLAVDATTQVYSDGVRLTGQFPLRMSEYHIRPVTALGGAIQLRDQLQVAFDLVALKEPA